VKLTNNVECQPSSSKVDFKQLYSAQKFNFADDPELKKAVYKEFMRGIGRNATSASEMMQTRQFAYCLKFGI